MSTTLERPRSLLWLAGFLAAAFAVAALGSLATINNVDGWYADAAKPPFNPPNWLFGPVWTILYAAMAVAAWLVWRKGGDLRLWWIQLAINLAWTPVFFAAELLWPGLVVIVALALSSSGRAESWSARPTGPSESAASIVCCTCIVNWPLTASPLFAPSHA